MSEQTVTMSIPTDIYAELGSVPSHKGRLTKKLQLDLAVGMFVSGELSLARASSFAGMSIAAFSELLNGFGVPVVEYTEEMLADDLAFAESVSV